MKVILQKLLEFYRQLSLRWKFTFLISLMMLFVVLILSMAFLEAEESALTEKVNEICEVSVQNLSSVARDNLLTENYVPIQDVINNFVRLQIQGFQFAFVTDRTGRIVAHSDPRQITRRYEQFPALLEVGQSLVVHRFRDRFEYIRLLVQEMVDSTGESSARPIGAVSVAFSSNLVTEALGRARRTLFFLTFGAIGIGIFLVYWFSRGMSRDIIALAEGAKEVAGGNLDFMMKTGRKDEIGTLAEEFNRMTGSLREKLRMQKYVSRLTVDMIRNLEAQESTGDKVAVKEICVLFTDIRGFTRLSEKLGPEQLFEIVNIYLQLQSQCIESNGGVIDKFAGDQVMAIFQGQEACDAAVKAAMSIQSRIADINRVRRKENKEYLTVGIGINFGEAMIGSMGAASRLDYTAIGDVVNLASKLCNFARAGHIIITRNVVQQLTGAYSIIKMEAVTLSGRSKPVQVYRIVYGN